MPLAKVTDGAKIRATLAHDRHKGQIPLATPTLSYGSKTPPHSTHTATGTPSSPDQTADLPAFPVHRGHTSDANPTWAPHRAGKRPGRLREAWTQDYGPADDSAEAPRDDRFYHHPRSSRLSKGMRN